MFEFYEFYVRTFALALPLAVIAIATYGAVHARLSAFQIGAMVAVMGAIFGIWYAWATPLSEAGVFNVPATLSEPPVVLMFLFGGSILVWALAWWTPLGRRITEATPLAAIAALQIPRVMGGLFIVGLIAGDIPALFAIPAGLGDIWAGIAGWQATQALARGDANANKLLARANLIGILDFVGALCTGIISSSGALQLFYFDDPNIINDAPLAMFPAFFVPIFLGFHFIAISRLRQERRMTPLEVARA